MPPPGRRGASLTTTAPLRAGFNPLLRPCLVVTIGFTLAMTLIGIPLATMSPSSGRSGTGSTKLPRRCGRNPDRRRRYGRSPWMYGSIAAASARIAPAPTA